DVDGDGKNEVVFINKNIVYLYRYTEGTIAKIKEFTGRNFDSFFGVDVADINGNGKAEIFVNNLITTNRKLSSFVLEWDGSKLVKIVDDETRFFRVIRVPKQGAILLGQTLVGDRVYSNRVEELTWQGQRYAVASEKRYQLAVNVMGIAFGAFATDGRELAVAFTEDDYFHMFNNTDGSHTWKSEEKYGGNSLYLEFPDENAAPIGDYREMKHIYLPQRIHIADINKDGKNEVLVPKNIDFAGRHLGRMRIYERGHIEGFDWSELGLNPKWKTRRLPGYISDWVIADLDNDGQDEIVCSVVTMTAPIIGEEKSYVVMMEFN
ncbi:MAG: VCBS repeat-containing protein, partial [Acidobacteriota bacterium]